MEQPDWPQVEREVLGSDRLPPLTRPRQTRSGRVSRGNLATLLVVRSQHRGRRRPSDERATAGRSRRLAHGSWTGRRPARTAMACASPRVGPILRRASATGRRRYFWRSPSVTATKNARTTAALASAVQGWAVLAAAGCPWRGRPRPAARRHLATADRRAAGVGHRDDVGRLSSRPPCGGRRGGADGAIPRLDPGTCLRSSALGGGEPCRSLAFASHVAAPLDGGVRRQPDRAGCASPLCAQVKT